MRAEWLCGFMVTWLVIFPGRVWAYEAIENFDSQIQVNQDTSLTISERIDYQTDEAHHGIYRYIPTQYRVDGLIVKAPISDITVTDENGKKLPFKKTRENRNLVLKIGDPEQTFSGNKTYIISYRVDEAVKRFSDHDELYWDITGEGWQLPVNATKALVTSDFAKIEKVQCYAGAVGSDNGRCISEMGANKGGFTYKDQVNYGENVTVAVAFNQNNQLIFPTTIQKWTKQAVANWFVFFLCLPLFIMAVYWYMTGRDYVFYDPNVFDLDPNKPYHKKPLFNGSRIPFVYEPITALTPGEAGAIVDEKVDMQDIVAEIIDLARKKYLTIKRVEKEGFLSNSTDYTFENLSKNQDELPKHQQIILEGLFDNQTFSKLSGLKGTFYKTISKVRQEIEDSLTARKLYVNNPKFSRGVGLALAITLNVLVFLIIGKSLAFVQSFSWYALFGLQATLSLVFGFNTTQKTAIGSNLSMQAKGLRRTIQYGKWREEIKEKMLFIEEVLPFAVALGVIKQLTNDMRVLGLEPPQYFSSPGLTNMTFHSFVADFSTQAASSLAYNPASHNASGGSGFSGGSSGGGGGGGGGGSW